MKAPSAVGVGRAVGASMTVILREGAMYRLPSGQRVIASQGPEGWVLTHAGEWDVAAPSEYSVAADGAIEHAGASTGWTTANLRPG